MSMRLLLINSSMFSSQVIHASVAVSQLRNVPSGNVMDQRKQVIQAQILTLKKRRLHNKVVQLSTGWAVNSKKMEKGQEVFRHKRLQSQVQLSFTNLTAFSVDFLYVV